MNLAFPKIRTANRHGFTLVELMLVIAIIGVLSTLTLGVMKSAADDAKEAATKARINQIVAMLQVEMEDYEIQRLPISVGDMMSAVANSTNSTDMTPNMMHHVRQLKRRIVQDIISAEMPRPLVDNMGQFQFNDDLGKFPTENAAFGRPEGFREFLDSHFGTPVANSVINLLEARATAKIRVYRTYLNRLNAPGGAGQANFDLPGEYLYLILQHVDFDGDSALEVLGSRAVGDSDGDGIFEIVDAWGEPMQLRVFQRGATQNTSTANGVIDDVWDELPDNQVDFDDGDATVVPRGYSVLDPTVPRELDVIRFDVVSTKMGRHTGN